MYSRKKATLYGFEDYSLILLDGSIIDEYLHSYYKPFASRYNGVYIIDDNFPVLYDAYGGIQIKAGLSEDHKELAETADRVYVHPSCRISRTMVFDKYKKSRSPWVSDAVVIPNPNADGILYDNAALFVNEEIKAIFMFIFYNNYDTYKVASALEVGTLLKWLLCDKEMDIIINSISTSQHITWHDLQYSELMHVGHVVYVPNRHSYLADLFTGQLPKDKIIYEETLQAALGGEDNKIDLTVLLSVRDMMVSSDVETRGAGLKALSMMDYMHYPNSIKLMLSNTKSYNWRYLSAANSISVKFMLKQLYGQGRRGVIRWNYNYDSTIYAEDYNLFIELKAALEGISLKEATQRMSCLPFMSETDTPFLRTR